MPTFPLLAILMIEKVAARLKRAFSPELLLHFKKAASAYEASSERSVAEFLAEELPETYAIYMKLPGNEDRLVFETAITWQATRLYPAMAWYAKSCPSIPLLSETGAG